MRLSGNNQRAPEKRLSNEPTGTTGWAPVSKPLLLAGGAAENAVRISRSAVRGDSTLSACFTTRGAVDYLDHAYSGREILMFGRESAGVPPHVADAADVRLRIPMREGLRSLNIAMAVAMAAGEAIRQTRVRTSG